MIKLIVVSSAALVLGACASQIGYHGTQFDEPNERFGEAVRQNIAAQTVTPGGSSEEVQISGARVARANAAYAADSVEKPRGQSTQGGSSAAGSGPN